MSFIKALAKRQKDNNPTMVTDQLVKFLGSVEDNYAKDGKFHVSSLYYMCPRCEVYKQVLPSDITPPEKLDVITKAKFDIGHALHGWYQNRYLGPMCVLAGKWICLLCGNKVGSDSEFVLRPQVCPKCLKSGDWEYDECLVSSPELNIAGKCDGVILSNGEKYVLDMKTSDPTLFERMKTPWPSNIYQVQVYMWLLGIKKGLLLYIDKSANGSVPVKEFEVEYSADTINDVKGKITAFNLAMKTHTLPDCCCRKNSGFKIKCSEIEGVKAVTSVIEKWKGESAHG